MSHDVLDMTLEKLLNAEQAFAAHARYHVCREILSEVVLYDGKPLPSGLMARIKDIVAIRAHNDNPMSQRLNYWIDQSEQYRKGMMTANTELSEARKRIQELENKK